MKKGLLLFALIFSSTMLASVSEKTEQRGWSNKAIARCVIAGIGCLSASSACLKTVGQVAWAGGYLSCRSNDPSHFMLLSSLGIIALLYTAVALDYTGKGLLGVAGYKTYEKFTTKEKSLGSLTTRSASKSHPLESCDDIQP